MATRADDFSASLPGAGTIADREYKRLVETLGVNPTGKTLADLYKLANEPRRMDSNYKPGLTARRNSASNPALQSGSFSNWSTMPNRSIITAPWNPSRSAAQVLAAGGATFYIFAAYSVDSFKLGDTVTVQATVQLPVGSWLYKSNVHCLAGNVYFGGTGVAVPSPTDGLPFQVSSTYTLDQDVPPVNLGISLLVYTSGGSVLPLDTPVIMGDCITEKTSQVLPFFDGAKPADSNYTYAWQGAVGNSASIATPK